MFWVLFYFDSPNYTTFSLSFSFEEKTTATSACTPTTKIPSVAAFGNVVYTNNRYVMLVWFSLLLHTFLFRWFRYLGGFRDYKSISRPHIVRTGFSFQCIF